MTIVVQKKYEVYEDERETSQDMKQDSKQDIGCGNGNCQDGSSVEIVLENFTINVFFDGTGNNAHNTEFRLLDEEYAELQKKRMFYKKELKDSIFQEIKINDLTERNGKTYIIQREPSRRERIQAEQKLREEQSQLEKTISEIESEMDRLIDEKQYKDRTYQKEVNVSYENEFSNVALLHLGSDEFLKNSQNIYIEGAGTSKDEADDIDGLGMADGEKSGVYVRINEAFEKIHTVIDKIEAKRYQVNVFGFSRGSFYARVFCAWLKADESDRDGEAHTHNFRYHFLKTSPKLFKIALLGIYDTVSSHGLEHYDDPEGSGSTSIFSLFDSDKFPLAITNDAQEIGKIVHLTAQNDYREHFPLTPITAALKRQPTKGGSALEISFPGAHSNLGGAYTDVWEEKQHYLSLVDEGVSKEERDGAIHWQKWVNKGYYLEEELSQSVKYKLKSGRFIDMEDSRTPYYYYVANRRVRNHFQYTTFGAMRMAAEKFGKMRFNESKERLQERLNIFEQAKAGNDLNKAEASKYQKEITEERARVLREIDSRIQEKMTKCMDKHGRFRFELSEYLSDNDQKCFYGTFICNSLQPIYRPAEVAIGWINQFEPITQDRASIDKYDIYPEKKNVSKLGRGKKIITFKGIENEGSSKKNQEGGFPSRPTVEMGG